MIKVENIEVWGFEHAIRGMRNPMNSWSKSDSYFDSTHSDIGDNDLRLMRTLYKSGTEHRKYLRQIFASMDITAPLYWWKEFDTYKIGTVANSCSTMHKINAKEFVLEDFSCEHLTPAALSVLGSVIQRLNLARRYYNEKKEDENTGINWRDYWWDMIQLLPTSYNQRRTVTMNYENVVNIVKQRTGHKLDEWNDFVRVLRGLDHVKEIIEKK